MRSFVALFGCAAKLKPRYKHTRREPDAWRLACSRLCFRLKSQKVSFTPPRRVAGPYAGSGPPGARSQPSDKSPSTPPRRPPRRHGTYTIPVLSRRPTSRPTRSRTARPPIFEPRTSAAVKAAQRASEEAPPEVQKEASAPRPASSRERHQSLAAPPRLELFCRVQLWSQPTQHARRPPSP